MRIPPDMRARCDECDERLDYDVGSIKWANIDVDLCNGCYAKRAIAHLFPDEPKTGETT